MSDAATRREPALGTLRQVAFTGGGSAGHVVPCMPLMARLRSRGVAVSFIGSASGLEERLIAPSGVPFFSIPTGKLRRYWSLENLTDIGRIVLGVGAAWRLLGRLDPDVVFSKGGFVSFPVVVAAWLRRIPVVAHESDLTPGLANRLALPFVAVLCTSFPETHSRSRRSRTVHTGTPLRPELFAASAERGRALVGAGSGDRILLIVGGSLGAETLNRAVRDALQALTERFHVVHVCGAGRTLPHLSGMRYRQYEYIAAEWSDVLAAADLVLSRAGANTLYELIALGKPHVLVPLPLRASRGDQLENARYAQRHGWSDVLEEEELTTERLLATLDRLASALDARRKALEASGFRDGTDAIVAAIGEVRRAARFR